MLQEACGAKGSKELEVQRMSVSGSSFPNDATTQTATVSVYGAELYFYSGVNVNRALSLTNTTVSGSGAVFNKEVNLTRSASKPNGTATTFAMSSSTFKNKLTSNGYNFDISSLYLEVPASYKNKEFANFKFQGGETVEGGTWYVYPAGRYQQEYYGTTISVQGPSSGSVVNFYTNLRLGYRSGDFSTRQMNMVLSGNLIWNMYNGSRNYTILLSPNSQIYSSDYGSGDYAKIKYSSNGYWKKCGMRDRQGIPWRHRWWSFGCKENNHCNNQTGDKDYIVCDVNKNNKSTIKYAAWYTQGAGKSSNKNTCPVRVDTIYKDDNSCSFSSDHCGAERYFNCES